MTAHTNLVASMSYEERCNYYHQHHPSRWLSTNPDYLEYAALLRYLGYHSETHVLKLIGAAYECLAGTDERKVKVEEVLEMLSHPWREVLAQLESYPPVAPLLVPIQILAVWQSNPTETGAHAAAIFGDSVHFLEECLAFLAEKASEHAAAVERTKTELEWQEQIKICEKDTRKRLRNESILAIIDSFLLVALGVLLGWIAAKA